MSSPPATRLRSPSRPSRWLLLLALGLGPAACGRSCGCVEGEKTYESLNGKVKVSLVRNVHWSSGRVPGPVTEFHLHVETSPSFDEAISCAHVDMAEDDAGKHVAYRCDGDKGWTVLHLRGGNRHVRECDAPVGTSKKPDFTKLVPLHDEDVAARVLACAKRDDITIQMAELVRAAVEDGGDDGAIKLVAHLAARSLREPWEAGLEVLGADQQGRVKALVCPSLEASDVAPAATYVRAAMRCSLDAPRITDGALGMLRARLEDEHPSALDGPDAGASEHDEATRESDVMSAKERALLWSAMIASEKNPSAAGAITCAALTSSAALEKDTWGRRSQIAAIVLGRTKTKCAAASRWFSNACGDAVDCGSVSGEDQAEDAATKTDARHLCTEDELVKHLVLPWREAVAQAESTSARATRHEPILPDRQRSYLFAAYALGLPREVAVTNARRRYAFVDAGAAADCREKSLDAGASCHCSELDSFARCQAKVDETTYRWHGCSVHFDDAHQRIDNVKRTCEGEGKKCNWSSIVCCGDLRCEPSGVCGVDPTTRPRATDAGGPGRGTRQ